MVNTNLGSWNFGGSKYTNCTRLLSDVNATCLLAVYTGGTIPNVGYYYGGKVMLTQYPSSEQATSAFVGFLDNMRILESRGDTVIKKTSLGANQYYLQIGQVEGMAKEAYWYSNESVIWIISTYYTENILLMGDAAPDIPPEVLSAYFEIYPSSIQ